MGRCAPTCRCVPSRFGLRSLERAAGIPLGRVEGQHVNGRTAVPLHPPLGRVRLERNRDVGLSKSHRRDYRAAVNQFCFTGRGTHEVHA